MFTLFVSLLMCAWVSLSREMELLLRPPTTAISVLKFCNSSSFCQRRRRKHQARGQRSKQQRNVLDTAEGNFRACENERREGKGQKTFTAEQTQLDTRGGKKT